MTKPNMLIRIDCGSRHPAAVSTKKLIELPAFKQLKKTAGVAVEINSGQLPENQKRQLVQDEINRHLKDALSKEIVTSILDAATKTNNWMIIDRSNSKSSSAGAELMLEKSLGMSSQKPAVLVFDSISRYTNFKPCRTVNMQLLLLGDVLCGSHALDDDGGVCEVDGLYNESDFDKWEPYHVRDPLSLSDPEILDEQLQIEGDRRLPRVPEEEMIMVDDVGRKRRTSDGRPLITPESKWLFHYRQYLYNCGSHYVIFENAEDSAFPLKSNGVPWPEGNIYANGGNLSYDRIQQSLSTGTPTVMLYNTGGVAQTFSSLHQWCVSKHIQIGDECRRTGNDPTRLVLSRADVVSTEPWTKRFGVSTVSGFQRLVKRAPEVMRKSVVVVDVLRETPEQVVEKVTGAFASGGKGLPELGLGSAEEDVVLDAWQTHMIYTDNAMRFRRDGDFFYYFSLVLTFISAVCAVLITKKDYIGEMTNALDFDMGDFFNRLLLIIPIVSTVVASIISKKRLIQKWASLKTAAAQIVCEIYKFRNRVLEYDPFFSSGNGGDGDDKDEEGDTGGEPAKPFNAREVFVERLQEINKFALDSVDETSLQLHSITKLDLNEEVQKDTFKQVLRTYVPKRVYGGHAPSDSSPGAGNILCCLRRSKERSKAKIHPLNSSPTYSFEPTSITPTSPSKLEEGEGGIDHQEQEEGVNTQEIEPDDFVSPIVIETYIEFRAKQLLKLCQSTSRPIAKRVSDFEMVLILIGAGGTLLSALDQPRWVAVTVAGATCLMNVMQHQMLQQRLSSTNSALRELSNCKILMDSLSVVSKRTHEMKTICVNTVETAILETTTAWTGMSARPSVKVSEGD